MVFYRRLEVSVCDDVPRHEYERVRLDDVLLVQLPKSVTGVVDGAVGYGSDLDVDVIDIFLHMLGYQL